MKKNTPSHLAELCAAIRAVHFLYGERPFLIEDPFAIELIGPEMREYVMSGKQTRPSSSAAIVLGRARYTENLLEEAIRSGIDQYVILGAGMDTFALRRPDLMEKVRVYEIDHPETQAWKQDMLAHLDRELPATLEFIPADLEHETITDALGRSSFRKESRVFFSWLGTVPYLTHEAVIRSLESLAASFCTGSEIIFDYNVSMEFVYPEDVPEVEIGHQHAAKVGEAKLSFLDPQVFLDQVGKMGFEVVESLTPKEMRERYFSGRNDVELPLSHHYYAYLRISGFGHDNRG